MNRAKSVQGSYEVPFHKCQSCYHNTGRYILDCYCVICENCYKPTDADICLFCHKSTNNRKLDTKDAVTFEKVGCMFGRPENMLDKGIEILRFQRTITNRYVQHIETELKHYKSSVYDLVKNNPKLEKYFSKRIKGFRMPPNQVNDHHRSKSEMIQGPNKANKSVNIEEPRRDNRQKEAKYLASKPGAPRNSGQPQPIKMQQHNYREQPPKPQKQYAPKVPQQYAVESDDAEHSFYDWQDRIPKNNYYAQEHTKNKEDNRWDNHQEYQRVGKPKEKSRKRNVQSINQLNSDIPDSSHMGKRSSGSRSFLANGFRRRP